MFAAIRRIQFQVAAAVVLTCTSVGRFRIRLPMWCVTLLLMALLPAAILSDDFSQHVIYQIVTDRFFDGETSNNDPPQSRGLYDASKSNWKAYWGGDLAGIRLKLDYLKGMGVSAIWISPPVDNEDKNLSDQPPDGPYHGYSARDFKRIEEHFGDATNSWAAFDQLVSAAHGKGIKIIVDFAPNHSSYENGGEFGALYDNGNLLAKYSDDTKGYFHHGPILSDSDYGNRYKVQYWTLSGLADLNQENPGVDKYLKDAARLFQAHGADGFRVDAIKHTIWGWLYSFANTLHANHDTFLFGEWIADSTGDVLYRDLRKFANHSGMSVLDFPLYNAIDDVFAWDQSFRRIDDVIVQEGADFVQQNDLVTFIDNHDRKRFSTLTQNRNRLHEALAFLVMCRGVPTIYYGTEQYLHNDTNFGDDPYNRPMMTNWDNATAAYKLVRHLADLRSSNPAVAYGSMRQRWITDDIYIFERVFAGNVVLVAINKSDSVSYPISGLFTALPPGNYPNLISDDFGALDLNVTAGSGNNPATAFALPAHAVAIWNAKAVMPDLALGSIIPNVAQAGVAVTLSGQGFSGATVVKFGSAVASTIAVSPNALRVRVPSVNSGNYAVTLANATSMSNALSFTVLGAPLIPVTFTVKNAIPTNFGDEIFLTGDTIELSQWNTTWDGAIGPMLAPNYPNWFLDVSLPAGKTVQFKFLKIKKDGTVTWESGDNHRYIVPSSGTGFVDVDWQR
jgi:glycosidase